MKMIDETRWQSDEYVNNLAGDPQTRSMLHHYLIAAVTERAACVPSDEPAYDALVNRLSDAFERSSSP